MLDASLDHVAIAVRDLRAAIPLYTDVLGASFLMAGDERNAGFRWAQFRFPGGGKIELVTPLGPDSFLARFLDERGEGVHHVTLRVPNIARAIAHVRAQGIEPVRISIEDPGWKEAFVHPRDANGALIQIAQSALSDEDFVRHHLEPHPDGHHHLRLEDLLA